MYKVRLDAMNFAEKNFLNGKFIRILLERVQFLMRFIPLCSYNLYILKYDYIFIKWTDIIYFYSFI